MTWTFLSHHAQVLVCIALDPDVRLRDVATQIGITERAAQAIVSELVEDGYLTRVRVGRRNHYHVHGERPLRHPLQRDIDVDALLQLVSAPRRPASGTSAAVSPKAPRA